MDQKTTVTRRMTHIDRNEIIIEYKEIGRGYDR